MAEHTFRCIPGLWCSTQRAALVSDEPVITQWIFSYPNTGRVNQGTFYTTFPKSLNPSLFDAQQVGGRCAESHRHFYRGPFYFSILNGSTLPAITLQPPHSSVPAHPTTHPPHALVCNFFRRYCGFSWTWWELGDFGPIENRVQSNIKIIQKESSSDFSSPECFCIQTPEYILCKGKRESIRYVNINIYEINPEVSTLLWLWMSWSLFRGG